MTDLLTPEQELKEWPRVTAARICAMPDIEDRRRAIAEVPASMQALVRKHVEIHFERKKWK